MTEFNKEYEKMVIRDLCRFTYAATGELEAPKRYNKKERAIWDDEVKQIQQDEAQSV